MQKEQTVFLMNKITWAKGTYDPDAMNPQTNKRGTFASFGRGEGDNETVVVEPVVAGNGAWNTVCYTIYAVYSTVQPENETVTVHYGYMDGDAWKEFKAERWKPEEAPAN